MNKIEIDYEDNKDLNQVKINYRDKKDNIVIKINYGNNKDNFEVKTNDSNNKESISWEIAICCILSLPQPCLANIIDLNNNIASMAQFCMI